MLQSKELKNIKGILRNKGSSVTKKQLQRRISWGDIRQRNFFEDPSFKISWEDDEIKPLIEGDFSMMEKIFHNQVDMNSNETSINDLIPNFFTVFNENNENDPLNKTYINDEQNIVLSNECCGNDNNSKDREVCKNLNEILNNEAIENNMESKNHLVDDPQPFCFLDNAKPHDIFGEKTKEMFGIERKPIQPPISEKDSQENNGYKNDDDSCMDDLLQNFLKNKENIKSEIYALENKNKFGEEFPKQIQIDIKSKIPETKQEESKKRRSYLLDQFQINNELANKDNIDNITEKNKHYDIGKLFFQDIKIDEKKNIQPELLIKDIEEMTSASKHNKIDEEFKNFYKAIESKNQENNELFNKMFNIVPSIETKNLVINNISPWKEQKNEKLRNLTFSPSLLLEDPEFSICDKTYLKTCQDDSDEKQTKGVLTEKPNEDNNNKEKNNNASMHEKNLREARKSLIMERVLETINENSEDKGEETDQASISMKTESIPRVANFAANSDDKENMPYFVSNSKEKANKNDDDDLSSKISIHVLNSSSKSVHFVTTFSDEKEKKKFKKTPLLAKKRSHKKMEDECRNSSSPSIKIKRLRFSSPISDNNVINTLNEKRESSQHKVRSNDKNNAEIIFDSFILEKSSKINRLSNVVLSEITEIPQDPIIKLIEMSPLPADKRNKLVELINSKKGNANDFDESQFLENLRKIFSKKILTAKNISQKLQERKNELNTIKSKKNKMNEMISLLKKEMEEKKENKSIFMKKQDEKRFQMIKRRNALEIICGINIKNPMEFLQTKIFKFYLPCISKALHIIEFRDKFLKNLVLNTIETKKCEKEFIVDSNKIDEYIKKNLDALSSEKTNFFDVLHFVSFNYYSIYCSKNRIKNMAKQYIFGEVEVLGKDDCYEILVKSSKEKRRFEVGFGLNEWNKVSKIIESAFLKIRS